MRRILLTGLLLAASAFGQGSNTIFQKLFTAQATAGVQSANVRNQGQQYHLLFIQLTGSGCTSGTYTGNIHIEASYDGSNWLQVGAPIEAVEAGAMSFNGAVTSASGAYTYVRANYSRLFGTTGQCALTAYYAGSITGTLTGSAPFTAAQDTFQYGFGVLTATTGALIATCQPPTTAQLYSWVLSAPGGANTITLEGKIGSSVQWQFGVPLPLTGVSELPQGSRPYFTITPTAPVSSSSTLAISAATAATEVDYFVSYRCE